MWLIQILGMIVHTKETKCPIYIRCTIHTSLQSWLPMTVFNATSSICISSQHRRRIKLCTWAPKTLLGLNLADWMTLRERRGWETSMLTYTLQVTRPSSTKSPITTHSLQEKTTITRTTNLLTLNKMWMPHLPRDTQKGNKCSKWLKTFKSSTLSPISTNFITSE